MGVHLHHTEVEKAGEFIILQCTSHGRRLWWSTGWRENCTKLFNNKEIEVDTTNIHWRKYTPKTRKDQRKLKAALTFESTYVGGVGQRRTVSIIKYSHDHSSVSIVFPFLLELVLCHHSVVFTIFSLIIVHLQSNHRIIISFPSWIIIV